MKTTRRITAVILTAVLVLCSLTVAASAASAPKDNLKITVKTDKTSYGLFEKAVITIDVENTGSTVLENVRAGVSGGNYLPVRGSTVNGGAPVLAPGASICVPFSAVISPDTEGLNFIFSLLLKIRGLFLKTDEIPLTGISSEYAVCASAEVLHAKAKAVVTAYAVCDGEFVPADGDAEELLAMYNNAVTATNQKYASVPQKISAELIDFSTSSISSENVESLRELGTLFYVGGEAMDKLPGSGAVLAQDVSSIQKYTNADGNTLVALKINEQKVTDKSSGGPATRAFSAAENTSAFVETLGGLVTGAENLTLTYTDCEIYAVIDANGYIVSGVWEYTLVVDMGDGFIVHIPYGRTQLTLDMSNMRYSIKNDIIFEG